jgi:hypothetical protein
MIRYPLPIENSEEPDIFETRRMKKFETAYLHRACSLGQNRSPSGGNRASSS